MLSVHVQFSYVCDLCRSDSGENWGFRPNIFNQDSQGHYSSTYGFGGSLVVSLLFTVLLWISISTLVEKKG